MTALENLLIKDYEGGINIIESLIYISLNSNILCTLSFISRRFSSFTDVVPVVSYNNVDEDKKLI